MEQSVKFPEKWQIFVLWTEIYSIYEVTYLLRGDVVMYTKLPVGGPHIYSNYDYLASN